MKHIVGLCVLPLAAAAVPITLSPVSSTADIFVRISSGCESCRGADTPLLDIQRRKRRRALDVERAGAILAREHPAVEDR